MIIQDQVFDSRRGHWDFTLKAFRPENDPRVDSASDRNEYQEYLLEVKGGPCVGLTTLPPSRADCVKILGALTAWNPKGLSRPLMGHSNKAKYDNGTHYAPSFSCSFVCAASHAFGAQL